MSKLQNEILDHIPTYKKNKRGKRIKKKLKIEKKNKNYKMKVINLYEYTKLNLNSTLH